MKNKRTLQNIILVSLIVVSFFLRSDTIPQNSHSVERTVVITNCDDFQDIQMIGYISGVMVPAKSFYTIEENQQLTKGYKFNTLHICGIKKTTLESIGGIENLTEEYIYANTTRLPSILSSGVYYIKNSSSLSKDELFYEIVKNSEDNFNIELRKRVLTFDDDQKTINY